MTGEQHDLRLKHFFWAARSAVALCATLLASATAIQCSASGSDRSDLGPSGGSSSGGRGSGGSSTGGRGNSDGALVFDVQAKDYTAEEFFINDPPPQTCDGGGKAVIPGGTPECPNDKNLPGCGCPTEGQTAACWPGYRRHRNRGNCADGQTTCVRTGENTLKWGPCSNYTGIDPATKMPVGTTGKAACLCFSGGFWQIDNTSPCFFCSAQGCPTGTTTGAVSTLQQGEAGVAANCPPTFALPNQPWSRNRVTADCNGFFKLCYTLKAGDSMNPMPTDCILQQVCTSDHYDGASVDGGADVPEEFPPLPAWITSGAQNDCARRFVDTGGYAEMSVEGESDECDKVPYKQFQRVRYCPLRCNDPANRMLPECINCTNGGGGPF
jgi:hypothetical protein